MMTPADREWCRWRAQWETYAEACEEIIEERREWTARGFVHPPECDESDERRFCTYWLLMDEARAHLMEERRHAA